MLERARSRRLERVRRGLVAGRARYERSWLKDFADRLSSLDAFNWATLFGACVLWSVVPMMILLSSLADQRIDDDLSRHIGLNRQGTHIIEGLFRHKPTHAVVPLVTGLIFAFAGSVTVASSLEVIYERLFGQEHRQWRDMPRLITWVIAMVGAVTVGNAVGVPVKAAAGPIARAAWSFAIVGTFFGWTMHFLGRVPWRVVVRPAIATALCWVGFTVFSSLYFSSALLDDHRLYGTIGVVFTLLTWLIVLSTVIVLGAVLGAVWQDRATRRQTAVVSSQTPTEGR